MLINWELKNNSFMKIHTYLSLLIVSLLMTSCGSYKENLYMQNEEMLQQSAHTNLYDVHIMPKDMLNIVVSTTDPAASAPFNLVVQGSTSNNSNSRDLSGLQSNNSQYRLQQYLVDNEGRIEFPVIGFIKVSGLTTRECEAMFREKLQSFLKETPIVTVRTSNYKITVLGEVASPGTIIVSDEKINILEALAQAGDMTLFSVRNDVQLMREDAQGKRKIVHLDLNDADIALSPYYFLQQNDIIYVKPNKTKVRNNTFTSSTSIWITAFSVLTSLTSFILALSK